MGKHWCYFLFMLWFTYLIISSILLFAKGFLLSKNAQKINTTCVTLSEIHCPQNKSIASGYDHNCSDEAKISHLLQNIKEAPNICLPQKARVIFVIIDALRYDFAVFDDAVKNPLPFQNKLPILSKLLKTHPESSRLFKFIADPPTTTMQRLKALTTGSLPTFIDAGSNFATNEINEDNIIDQLFRHNFSSVLIGDDTWDGLYPNRFLRKYPYPSFDVWDLDTVDYGVNSHLYQELAQKDWNFLIAHYLGVDHCGHRYGPNHPEMARKLTEMDTVIENIVETLDSDTMLFVIGDHGMTETGNHGGDAEDEVTSALFIYSKKHLSVVNNQSDSVRQVDIVPTLAAIFGVSVPFSNLGTIILDAIPIMSNPDIEEWRFLLYYLWENVVQMLNYIEDYAKTSSDTFSDNDLQYLRDNFAILDKKLSNVDNEISFGHFARDCVHFLSDLRQTCEKVWIQFDAFSMTRGLLFLFLSLFFVYMITDGIPSNRLPEIFMSSFLTCSYVALFLAVCVSTVLYHFKVVSSLLSAIFFSTGLVSQFMLVMLVIQNWEVITLNWYDRGRRERMLNLLCRLVLIIHLGGLFSNSFVVEESSVLLFLLATTVLMGSLNVCVGVAKKAKIRWKFLFIAFGMLVMVRMSMYFWRCRDRLEQPWCYDTYNAFTLKAETTKLRWLVTVITLALFVTMTKTWLKHCGNLNGYSLTVIFFKYVPTVLVVCMSGYWVLSRLPKDARNRGRLWQGDVLAWTVYALSSLGIIVTIIKPLCVYILPDSDNVAVNNQTNAIPHVFQRIKKLFNEPSREEVPVLCGLGTAYSAAFVTIGVYLTSIFALLHGDASAPSTVIMFLASAFVLIIMSIIRLEKATTIEQLFEIPNMSLLAWVILTQYFFYGTGHQPSFPNIIWDAAFVGVSGTLKSNFIPGTLIILNTFCSQILMGFLLPLHIITPFTVSVVLPSLINKNILEKENLRGEVLLYERDGLMMTVAFKTSCKYMICHGIRVFTTMLAATIHCRHMMIWKIFAPKLIFESVGIFVTLAVVNLSYLVLLRINSKVDQLLVSLNKKCR